MQTSGPIRQDLGLHHAEGFGDIKPFAKNLYEATCDGKKCLLKTSLPGQTSLLRREYDISCNLQHPYILTPLRYSEDTPVGPAIVMEYVEGCTLTEFVAKGIGVYQQKVAMMFKGLKSQLQKTLNLCLISS